MTIFCGWKSGNGWLCGAEGSNGIGGWKVTVSFTSFRMTAKNKQRQLKTAIAELCALDGAGADGDGGGVFEALHRCVGYAGEEENREDCGDLPGGVVAFFD
jgi:hypothetical protein